MDLEVHPATAERFDDVASLLRPRRKDAAACWCLAFRLTSGEFNSLTPAQQPERLRELCRHTPPPGVIAYLEDKPVGWCGLGPRSGMERLMRSRTIPLVDEVPVWSIVCFVVKTGHRRQGIGHALLAGVIDYARASGAPSLEAYPVDPVGARISPTLAFVGTTGMFESAGFQRILKTEARSGGLPRWLMRLDLRSAIEGAG
ncbi:GNAT superfamily N-acetyltransferase [Arthrobacter sp. CAN_A212]|uniref:GNAT family N-acetyltransferase n=1 Tax=unclassified Arthrobacter TaxID=235627 RepID=UPI0018C97BFD|nr:GNAT family N-acetyltransferase [Arthrobacter sp. CAN_C5]MBP2214935.1 GNAT superfamily N-acetyltransferase [Arthrobacter sp. CAN_C5]